MTFKFNHLFWDRVHRYSPFLAVQQGLTPVLPLIIIGAFALLPLNLPCPLLHDLLELFLGEQWKSLFLFVQHGSFGVAALAVLFSAGYFHAVQLAHLQKGVYIHPLNFSIISLAAYFILVLPLDGNINASLFSFYGGFPIVLCIVILVPPLFVFLSVINPLKHYLYSAGSESSVGESLATTPVAIAILILVAVVRLVFAREGITDLMDTAQFIFTLPFESTVPSFATGLMYICISHICWFLGIPGSHLLTSLEQSWFPLALQANVESLAHGARGVYIFTKPFLDTFVITGGSGATLGLIAAILIKSRERSLKRLALIALIPALFNVNEVLIFGIPIVYNPVFFIPFMIAPIVQFLVAWVSTQLHLIPMVARDVHWTTPVGIGGYMATGCVAGIFVQCACVGASTLVYLPFVALANRTRAKRLVRDIKDLTHAVDRVALGDGRKKCVDLVGKTGHLAKLLSAELEQLLCNENEKYGRIYVVYQPQIDAVRQQVVGSEALCRWDHPVYGHIPPSLVVALAEDVGLINQLGMYVLQAACQLQADISRNVSDSLNIAVNFSIRQFEDPMLVDKISGVLDRTGLDPGLLKVEVTETVALAPGQSIVRELSTLRDMGVKIAVDDFGMGHTSLRYLKEFPVDYVKIDRSLTIDMENGANSHIIESIVYLCEAMDIKVIVEGVESRVQVDQFLDRRCSIYQGYYFSKPLPAEQFLEFLDQFSNKRESDFVLSDIAKG